jgi:hypothetical protein
MEGLDVALVAHERAVASRKVLAAVRELHPAWQLGIVPAVVPSALVTGTTAPEHL